MNEQLSILEQLPDDFLTLEPFNIRQVFPTPTLLHLKGNKSPPLFVSILLHGNEITGLKAMQSVLSRYEDILPRSLYLFIGNVAATEKNQRYLSNQVDYNRCWPGTDMPPNNITDLMLKVFEHVTQKPLFAAVDVHNNTGTNPHYAGITSVTQENQHLAAMFNHIALVYQHPKGVSTMAFNQVCPAVTLECGKPGDDVGILHAADYLDSLLHMDHLPQRPVAAHDLQLVKSLATLNIPDNVSFDFNLNAQVDLTFETGFERKNFTEIKTTDVFAHTRVDRPLAITNEYGEDVTDQIMRIENGRVYLNKTLIPAMITLDKTIIRQDCLCYLLADYHS